MQLSISFEVISNNAMNKKVLEKTLREIGLELRRLRMKKGFNTIKEFATKYRLPAIQYWRIENGKANVTIKSLGRILTIHKKSIEDFFRAF